MVTELTQEIPSTLLFCFPPLGSTQKDRNTRNSLLKDAGVVSTGNPVWTPLDGPAPVSGAPPSLNPWPVSAAPGPQATVTNGG